MIEKYLLKEIKTFEILTEFNNLVVEKLTDVFSGEIVDNCLIFDLSEDVVQSFDMLLKTITNIITSWSDDDRVTVLEDKAMEINKVFSIDVLLCNIIKVTLKDYND